MMTASCPGINKKIQPLLIVLAIGNIFGFPRLCYKSSIPIILNIVLEIQGARLILQEFVDDADTIVETTIDIIARINLSL